MPGPAAGYPPRPGRLAPCPAGHRRGRKAPPDPAASCSRKAVRGDYRRIGDNVPAFPCFPRPGILHSLCVFHRPSFGRLTARCCPCGGAGISVCGKRGSRLSQGVSCSLSRCDGRRPSRRAAPVGLTGFWYGTSFPAPPAFPRQRCARPGNRSKIRERYGSAAPGATTPEGTEIPRRNDCTGMRRRYDGTEMTPCRPCAVGPEAIPYRISLHRIAWHRIAHSQ